MASSLHFVATHQSFFNAMLYYFVFFHQIVLTVFDLLLVRVGCVRVHGWGLYLEHYVSDLLDLLDIGDVRVLELNRNGDPVGISSCHWILRSSGWGPEDPCFKRF